MTKDRDKDNELEGEGSYTAGRRYDERATEFAKSGKVEKAAEEAVSAFDSTEGSGDREAEQEGRKHAAEEDRLLRSDRESPEDPDPEKRH